MDTRIMHQRPAAITIFCGFAFVQWGITSISLVLFSLFRPNGYTLSLANVWAQLVNTTTGIATTDITPVLGILVLAVIVGTIGYWFMQRWAVVIYGAIVITIGIFVANATTVWNSASIYFLVMLLLFPIVMTGLGIYYFKQMK